MTLVEVLLAAMILGLGMMAIFTSLTRCLRLIQASRDVQKMQLAFDRGNLAHPMADIQSEDDIEKLLVEDADLGDGLENYVFTRTFDEKEKPEDDNDFNDHLFTVRTTVSWGEGDDAREEIVELLWLPKVVEWTGK
jgi:hypothetical protein